MGGIAGSSSPTGSELPVGASEIGTVLLGNLAALATGPHQDAIRIAPKHHGNRRISQPKQTAAHFYYDVRAGGVSLSENGAIAPRVYIQLSKGRDTVKVVFPGTLSTAIVPSCFVTIFWTMSSPKPLPSPGGFVVKNGSKILA